MSLQFIIGSSGAGKSYFAYKRIIQESLQHPEKNYYVIVPEDTGGDESGKRNPEY